MLRARALEAAGRRADADADRAEGRRLAPDSAAALRETARAALEAGDAKAALEASDRLVKAVAGATAAERSDARAGRAAALLALGRRAEAEASLKEAAALTPGALFPREELAVLALEDGLFEDAEKRAAELFDVAGSTFSRQRAAALVLRARVSLARGRSGDAVDDLAAALAVAPDSRAGLWTMVEALSRAGQNDRAKIFAERLFAGAAEEPPGSAGAVKTMVEVVETLTRLDRAEAALTDADVLLRRSASIPPSLLAQALDARAAALAALKRDDEALADLTKAAQADPSAREPKRRRARLLAELGRTAEVLAAADELVALSSGAAPAQAVEDLLWRAARRAEAGDAAGADADHASAEAELPGVHARDADSGIQWAAAEAKSRGWPAAWALLENLRTRAGAPAAARAAFAAAEAESRWSHGGDGARAVLDAALSADAAVACRAPLLDDRSQAAAPYLDACVARLPRDADLLNDRGVARWTAGKKEEALADFRAALAAKPGYLPAALSLASALDASGRPGGAKEVLNEALSQPQDDRSLVDAARAALAGLKP
jgi:predicted Zn-dependent protease